MNNIHEGIQRLLDNTGHFSREDWAVYLDVDEQTLEKWCDGRSLPTPRQLRSIICELDDVKRSDFVSPCIPQLIELVRQQRYPTSKMGRPSAKRRYTSIAYAILQPRIGFLNEILTSLPHSAAEEVADEWLRAFWKKKEELEATPPLSEYPPLTLVKREEIPEK